MDVRRKALIKTVWSSESYWRPNVRALIVLCFSLFVFGVGEGLLVLASLGSSPWTVLAQGISVGTGLNIGLCTLLISVVVMLTWIPFKQKLGLGTVLNVLLIALGLGVSVAFLSSPETITYRLILAILGIVIIGVASAFYLTCHMGAGPRDGLMVGLCQVTGWRVGVIRTSIEVVVCFIGWLLGGVVGVATLLFAFGVGWVLQLSLSVMMAYCPNEK